MYKMNRVIGLTGYVGAGKTTAAEYLVANHQYVRRPMARMLKLMLQAIGLAPAHVDGGLKNEPCDLLCGITPRQAMQTLGTEWGRDLIHQDLWVTLWKASVEKIGMPVVCDDVRFANEAAAIRKMGGIIVRIDRSTTRESDHRSETEMDSIRPDRLCRNLGSVDDLHAAVLQAAQ